MLRTTFRNELLKLPFLLALLFVAACGSDPSQPVVPGVEPEVLNNTDVFQLQVSAVQNYSGVLNYTWDNTGTMANVDQSCAVQPGQAVLSLLDADGTEVYSQDLATDGSFATDAGTIGDWHIRVTLSGMTGTLNFRAEKRTP